MPTTGDVNCRKSSSWLPTLAMISKLRHQHCRTWHGTWPLSRLAGACWTGPPTRPVCFPTRSCHAPMQPRAHAAHFWGFGGPSWIWLPTESSLHLWCTSVFLTAQVCSLDCELSPTLGQTAPSVSFLSDPLCSLSLIRLAFVPCAVMANECICGCKKNSGSDGRLARSCLFAINKKDEELRTEDEALMLAKHQRSVQVMKGEGGA
jgi:hypothetical protein